MSISKDIKKKTLKFITDAVGPMVKESLKQASSYSIDLADLAAVLTQDHKADLASDIDIKGLKASLDCVAQLKVLFSVIDRNEQTCKKLTGAFITSGIAVVSKLIKTSPCEVTGLCQDLCLASAHTSSFDFLTGDGWITFVKSVLKFCMKSAGGGTDDLVGVKSVTLETLSTLAQRVYEGGNRPAESKMMYEMVCGHSNFVPVLFSGKGEEVKARVLTLVLALMKANPRDILSEVHQLPLFLGAYKGTLSASDRAILSIIYLNEKHKPGRLGSYAPMLWGQSAISKYSSGKT